MLTLDRLLEDTSFAGGVMHVERPVYFEEREPVAAVDAVVRSQPRDLGLGHRGELRLVGIERGDPCLDGRTLCRLTVRVDERPRRVAQGRADDRRARDAERSSEPEPELGMVVLPVLLVPRVREERGANGRALGACMQGRQVPRKVRLERVVLARVVDERLARKLARGPRLVERVLEQVMLRNAQVNRGDRCHRHPFGPRSWKEWRASR